MPETTTYPLRVMDQEDGGFISEGHHEPEAFVAACCTHLREVAGWDAADVEDHYPDGIDPTHVRHKWTVFVLYAPNTDEGAYHERFNGVPVTEHTPGVIPLTTYHP